MLIDISRDEYMNFLKDKKENVKYEIEEFLETVDGRLPSNRPDIILENMDWLIEKKKEISEINEKIELLRITNE